MIWEVFNLETRNQKVTTRISNREKKALDEFANEWGIRSGTVLRRLILFLIQGKINIADLITQNENNNSAEENFYTLQSALTDVEKQQLLKVIKGWDFPLSVILRRLIRALLTGVISKNDLW